MSNGLGWIIAAVLLLVLLARHPMLMLLVPLSLIALWDFGPIGVGILWAVVMAVTSARRAGSPRPTLR